MQQVPSSPSRTVIALALVAAFLAGAFISQVASAVASAVAVGAPSASDVTARIADAGMPIDIVQPVTVPASAHVDGAKPVSMVNFRDPRVSAPNGTNASVEIFANSQDAARRLVAITQLRGALECDVVHGRILVRLFNGFAPDQLAQYTRVIDSLPS